MQITDRDSMNDNDEELTLYDKIEWGDIQPPDSVRCMSCGAMAEFEEPESSPECTVWIYGCYECRHWTEWEISPDEDGDIDSSVVYLVEMDDEDRESRPSRDFPYYWEPNEDGYTVPVAAETRTEGGDVYPI